MPTSFGAAVRAARTRRKLTQAALAELAGMATNAVALIERGEREPSLITAMKLAQALRVKVDALCDDEAAK